MNTRHRIVSFCVITLMAITAHAGYVQPPDSEVEWNPEWGCGADVRCEEIIYGTTTTGGKGGVAPKIELVSRDSVA